MAEHDSSYKLLFSFPEMVADLLRGFVPEAWVEGVDFDTLSGRLPPVLLVVLYNGSRRWTAAQEVGDLIEAVLGA